MENNELSHRKIYEETDNSKKRNFPVVDFDIQIFTVIGKASPFAPRPSDQEIVPPFAHM